VTNNREGISDSMELASNALELTAD